jgi:hypothetical protein
VGAAGSHDLLGVAGDAQVGDERAEVAADDRVVGRTGVPGQRD